MKRLGAVVSTLLLGAVSVLPALASPFAVKDLPDTLKPWIPWVLWQQEQQLCPAHANIDSQRHCSFLASLSLEAGTSGASFRLNWSLVLPRLVPLPGGEAQFPQEVQAGGKAIPVILKDGQPMVALEAGEHSLSGKFYWDSLPPSLAIPPQAALLELLVQGRRVDLPQIDEQGRIWFNNREQEEKGETDALSLIVSRHLEDQIPLHETVALDLNVAGKNREAVLGPIFTSAEVKPKSITSPLPARLDEQGRLRLAVRPGRWKIFVTGIHPRPVLELKPRAAAEPWPSEEVWAFAADPKTRVVTVEGVAAVDPQQTELPSEWRSLPVYRVTPDESMRLVERQRGEAEAAPDRIQVQRLMWLDFDGGHFTIKDKLQGSANRSWRLGVQKPAELGRVAADGKNVLITFGDNQEPGFELRQVKLEVEADMRLPRPGLSELSAAVWQADLAELKTTLVLPPGWLLLAAPGVDSVHGSWLSRWHLLNLFLVLVLALAVFKLKGWQWGLLALIGQALVIPEGDMTTYALLALLPAVALSRFFKPGLAANLTRGYLLGAAAWAILVVAELCLSQARLASFPVLEHPRRKLEIPATATNSTSMNTATSPASVTAPQGEPEMPMQQLAMEQNAGTVADDTEELAAPMPMPSAKAPPVRAEAKRDAKMLRKSVDNIGGNFGYAGAGKSQRQLSTYDPAAIVQTGPGLPSWSWQGISLGWNGPVAKEQKLQLWLVSPWINRLLCLLRIGLSVALLGALLLDDARRYWPKLKSLDSRALGTPLAILALVLAGAVAKPCAAEALPSTEMLNELRNRLTARPSCAPHCATIENLEISIESGVLRLNLRANTLADTLVPLPGQARHWLPSEILVNGNQARRLVREAEGTLAVALAPGAHQIIMRGRLPPRDSLQLDLPLLPQFVSAKVPGYSLDGLHENGVADASLVLVRAKNDQGGAATANTLDDGDAASNLPPLVRVERQLLLDLNWTVETKVQRVGGGPAAVVAKIPLLQGEKVMTPGVRVEKSQVLVNLGSQDQSLTWTSSLDVAEEITLQAQEGSTWFESWSLLASPIWHVVMQGIPPLAKGDQAPAKQPEWLPWPGESLHIKVTKPQAVAGASVTLERSTLSFKPGLRQSDAQLTLALRSSRGGEHRIKLPAGADLQAVTINNNVQPLKLDQGQLTLPITPGSQDIKISWRDAQGISSWYRNPSVNLQMPGVNASLSLMPARDRWILWLGGDGVGPAVLFWSQIFVLLIVAFALSQLSLVPIRLHHWIFLTLGLTQASLGEVFVMIGFFLALGSRRLYGPSLSTWRFNLCQLGLLAWAFYGLGIVLDTLHKGFFGTPEMRIQGNASSDAVLNWFVDRHQGLLPQGLVISVPLLVYQLAMLAWALWFAYFMVGRARWMFACYSEGGVFKKPKPRAAKPIPVPPPAPASPPAGDAPPSKPST